MTGFVPLLMVAELLSVIPVRLAISSVSIRCAVLTTLPSSGAVITACARSITSAALTAGMLMAHKKAWNVNDVVMNRTVCTNEPFEEMELNDGKCVAGSVRTNEHVTTLVEPVVDAGRNGQQSGCLVTALKNRFS